MVGRGSSAIRRSCESSRSDRFPHPPWCHPPVIGGVASPPAADLAGGAFRPGVKLARVTAPARNQRAAGSLADDDINKSSAPRGGGSVGRGALNLLLRGLFTADRRALTPPSLLLVGGAQGDFVFRTQALPVTWKKNVIAKIL